LTKFGEQADYESEELIKFWKIGIKENQLQHSEAKVRPVYLLIASHDTVLISMGMAEVCAPLSCI